MNKLTLSLSSLAFLATSSLSFASANDNSQGPNRANGASGMEQYLKQPIKDTSYNPWTIGLVGSYSQVEQNHNSSLSKISSSNYTLQQNPKGNTLAGGISFGKQWNVSSRISLRNSLSISYVKRSDSFSSPNNASVELRGEGYNAELGQTLDLNFYTTDYRFSPFLSLGLGFEHASTRLETSQESKNKNNISVLNLTFKENNWYALYGAGLKIENLSKYTFLWVKGEYLQYFKQHAYDQKVEVSHSPTTTEHFTTQTPESRKNHFRGSIGVGIGW